jgi:alpha/beta superfamily hydrolase
MPSRLEKQFTLPESNTHALVADQQSRVAVIVTHPWGPLGGNMHNNVVVAAALYFQKLGITTARFDFDGGVGRGYIQVAQVLEVARGLLNGKFSASKPSQIILIGYSYGSLIAGSASADLHECIANISIAPPFSVQHWLLMFNSTFHHDKATAKENLPRLLLIGTEDNFTSEEVFKTTVGTKYPGEVTTGAVIKGADHFFRHREKDVMDVIGQWLLATFPQCQGDLRRLKDMEIGLSHSSK